MDWKQISSLKVSFIAPVCSQILQDSNKLEETPSCSRAQMYDDSLQTHSDKRDKSRTVFNFPAFVSLFYSVLRDVESNNSFLLCVWTQCTASMFVRNSIIKRDMNGKKSLKKKESEHGFNWCLPVVWPLFPSPSFFCLSASLSLIRPAVESGSLGKRSRVWLELRLNEAGGGGGGASWGASTSDHFPHAIHHTV